MADLSRWMMMLPREIIQNEIITRVGSLSMMIVRHTLLGCSIDQDSFSGDMDAYRFGLGFLMWCLKHIQLDRIGFCIGVSGDLELVDFYYSDFGGNSGHVCDGAASVGDIRCLKYACDLDPFYDKETFARAAEGGSVECLKFLTDIKCAWDYDAMNELIRRGNLAGLEYLLNAGYLLDSRVCRVAAKSGQLECLKCLYRKGYCIAHDDAWEAIMHKHANCLQFIVEAVGHDVLTASMYGFAVLHRSLECIACLDSVQCPRNPDALNIALTHDLEFVKFLCELGHKPTKENRSKAEMFGKFDCIEYFDSLGI